MLLIAEIVTLIACVARLLIRFNLGYSSKNIYIMSISSVAYNFVFVYSIMLGIMLLLKLLSKKTKADYTEQKTEVIILVTAVVALVLSIL